MKPTDRKWPHANAAGQQPRRPAATPRQFRPPVAQTKSAAPAGAVRHPAAPPVYRPEVKSHAAQLKAAQPPPAKTPPSAPPAYRPQPTPKVLQTKSAVASPPSRNQAERKPCAPPVYRPQPAPKCLQLKRSNPAVNTPSVNLAAAGRAPGVRWMSGGGVVQPAMDRPQRAAAAKAEAKRKQSAKDAKEVDMQLEADGVSAEELAADDMLIAEKEAKGEGDIYLPPGIGVRPAKPAALWNAIYKNKTKFGKVYIIDCEESSTCGSTIMMEAEKFTEIVKGKSNGKRPPICHKIAYNFLIREWAQIAAAKSTNGYTGPDFHHDLPPMTDLGEKIHREIAWDDHNNLGPGHSACNSKTASEAKGDAVGPKKAKAREIVEKVLRANHVLT